jgi:hypothetical protein
MEKERLRTGNMSDRPWTAWLHKYGMLLIGIAIAAYAIHGLMGADLAMPYGIRRVVGGSKFFHLRGMWAIGGSICLLLSAAGFALLSYGKLIAKPGTKPGGEPHLKLAGGLILVGVIFFAGMNILGKVFARHSTNAGLIDGQTPRQFLDSHRLK